MSASAAALLQPTDNDYLIDELAQENAELHELLAKARELFNPIRLQSLLDNQAAELTERLTRSHEKELAQIEAELESAQRAMDSLRDQLSVVEQQRDQALADARRLHREATSKATSKAARA